MPRGKTSEKLPWYYRAKIDPKYDPENTLEDFESLEYCIKVRDDKINIITEWLAEEDEQIDRLTYRQRIPKREIRQRDEMLKRVEVLWTKLRRCSTATPCNSRACTVCRRQYRRAFVADLYEIALLRPVKFLTYCPLQGGLPYHMIDLALLHRLHKQFVKHMERHFPATAMALGSMDLKAYHEGLLEPHFHILVVGCSGEYLRKGEGKPKSFDGPWRKLGRKPPKIKRGLGAPWWVANVYPAAKWNVITYTVRQMPKRREVGHIPYRELMRYRHERRMEIYTLDIQRLLVLDSLSFDEATVCFRVERKNGLHYRAKLPRPSMRELAREVLADVRDRLEAQRRRRTREKLLRKKLGLKPKRRAA